MKKYILVIFTLCLILSGCSQNNNIKVDTTAKADTPIVIADTIKQQFLEYEKKDIYVINSVKVNTEVKENTMIRKSGKEIYVETDSKTLILYKEGVNYAYNTDSAEMIKLSDLQPDYKNQEIIKPFIQKSIQILNWSISNKDAFIVDKSEKTTNNTVFKVYTFTGKDNAWLKTQYDKTYGLFDFWKSSKLTFKFQYVFDKNDKLIQYIWDISDEAKTNVMHTDGKIGNNIEDAYSQTGFNFDSIFKNM